MNKKSVLIFLILVGLIAYLLLKKESPKFDKIASDESAAVQIPSQKIRKSVDHEKPQALKAALNLESKNTDQQKQILPAEVESVRHKIKSFLSAAYSSQMAFKAENDQYVTDILATGIFLDQVLTFKAGFLEPSLEPQGLSSESKLDVRRINTDFLIGERDLITNETYQYAPNASEIDLSAFKEFCKYGCTADKDHFEMLIAVPLGSADKVDVWIINDQKELIQIKDGTKPPIH